MTTIVDYTDDVIRTESPISKMELDSIIAQRKGWDPLWINESKRIKILGDIWRANGHIPGTSERVTIGDLIERDVAYCRKKFQTDSFSTHMPMLMPMVISDIVRTAGEIQANLYESRIFARFEVDIGRILTFQSWGGMHASDIPEGGEYPERELEAGGHNSAQVGKSGLAIKMSDELIEGSRFDIMDRHLQAAGAALARHKEVKIMAVVNENGVVIMDNSDSNVLSSSGRNAVGDKNGTINLDDLFFAYAQMVDLGFTPNTLLMHPASWQIWASEAITRHVAILSQMGSLLYKDPRAKGSGNVWANVGEGTRNVPTTATNVAQTSVDVPALFPTPLRIVTSPFVAYNATTKLCDLILLDDQESGYMAESGTVELEEWRDPMRDLNKIKLREFYSVNILNEGQGIGLLKNVKIGRSFDLSDNVTLQLTSGDIAQSLSGDQSSTATPNLL